VSMVETRAAIPYAGFRDLVGHHLQALPEAAPSEVDCMHAPQDFAAEHLPTGSATATSTPASAVWSAARDGWVSRANDSATDARTTIESFMMWSRSHANGADAVWTTMGSTSPRSRAPIQTAVSATRSARR